MGYYQHNLQNSVLFIMKNNSHRRTLSNKGPRMNMDPRGTPNKIFSQELYDKFIFLSVC